MHSKSEEQLEFDSAVAEMLACPGCCGDLCLESDCLVCAGCGRRYPVLDGIPVLIAERAEQDRNTRSH